MGFFMFFPGFRERRAIRSARHFAAIPKPNNCKNI